MTPALTRLWNRQIDDGDRIPYVILGFEEQVWLTMGQYDRRKDAYIEQLLEIIRIERLQRETAE